MICQIQIRNVYGEEKVYPYNSIAMRLAAIANTTTLTKQTLRHIWELGITIVEMDRLGQPSHCWNF